MPLHNDTPLVASRPLSLRTGRTVWLKLDALQVPGSFKIRGVGAACEAHARAGAKRFVSSSGGNAGMAVAYAGRMLGIPVTVVVPETATDHAKRLLGQDGAEVIVHGAAWAEANALAQGLVDENTAFIHPFDDPLLWQGHATLIDEVAASGVAFDGVVLCVGGGGLLAGVAEGLERNGLSALPILTAETEGAASLAASVEAKRHVSLPKVTSIATSLGAARVADHAFALSQSRPIRCGVVSDREALDACERFLDDHRILVEPACGATLALLYEERHRPLLDGLEAPLVVVCGGATVTVPKLAEWQASLAA
ncbi:pyridoxal-phosphate dependent enzyme [Aureimonas psammosilenae]|uniref:pyridoxal-phosphate dependent enzyme n=1 Tax=Aureimonas psammosilenae TaxID=2495496 RepID=UPI0012610B7F|nr:pyridoxal-phosphate dependent enzyme [Aureimonas psammosilenae]